MLTVNESNSINIGSAGLYAVNTSATASATASNYLEIWINDTKYKIPLFT